LPRVSEKAKAYLTEARNKLLLQDFVDSNLWTSKTLVQAENKFYVPLMLYFVDFETANPLGSRAGVYTCKGY